MKSTSPCPYAVRVLATPLLIFSLLFIPAAPAFALGVEVPPTPPIVTPPADTTPPVISGVATTSVLPTTAALVWTTNELSVSTFQYGTTQNYGSSASVSASLALGGTAALTGLAPSTTYYYCIHATDASSNSSQSCSSFTTAAVPIIADTVSPVIADVAGVSLEPHDANITWTTDELAVSTFEYGPTTSYGSSATLSGTALLAHTAELLGLTANTTYHYCIHATDLAGNVANSCSHSFTTAAVAVMLDTNPPTISLVTIAPITTTSATVGWTTDEVAGGYVEYGTTIGYGSETTFDTNLALTHSAGLTGLAPNTQYHYRVHSRDEAGNTVVTPDETFTTESLPVVPVVSTPTDTTPPSISGVATQSVSSSLATIAWDTNELAISTLEYGLTSSYGSSASLSASALLAHDATLVGLTPSTTYYYCIHATDLAGNATHSCGHSLTTSAPPLVPDTTAPVASNVVVSSITNSSAAVHWSSSEAADSQVQYGLTTNYGVETGVEAEPGLVGGAALTGLSPSTTYHFRVRSYDSSGNVGTSGDYTFTTAASSGGSGSSAAAAPIISEIGADTLGETGATINWLTDVPADSLVEYGNSENLGSTMSSATLTSSHAVALVGLSSGTNYYFRVVSKPAAGTAYQTTSTLHDFNTLAVPVIIDSPANITAVSGSTSGTSGSVSWTTDESTKGSIEYGLDTSYGSVVEGSMWNQAGTLSVATLLPGTTYHYRVKALDAGDNITYSADHTFTTSGSVPSSLQTTQPVAPAPSSSGGGGGGGPAFAPAPVPNLVTAEGVDSQIVFSWNNPKTSGFAGTVIVRKAGGYPNGPHDGQAIYNGSAQTFSDTSLQNGTTYYYALYSYNTTNQASNPIHVSTAPKAGVTEVKIDRNVVDEQALPAEHFTENLMLGQQSLEVEHLQQVLNTVGVHQSQLTTGYFGPLTLVALKQFQAKYNLPQTGVADAATRVVLDSISDGWMVQGAPTDLALLKDDLKRGDQGDEVGDLQEFLAFEGSYKEAKISNYFGSLTHTGVKQFQTSYGVTPVSGIVGPKTRHTIQTVLGL